MVVSFVNAGLLTLTQSIGVIMGANIGTTVTAWLISALGFKVDIAAFSLPLLAFGIPLPVSYTHLDVYKRQALSIICNTNVSDIAIYTDPFVILCVL